MSEIDPVPIRVMALHALVYCERLFYLEEVEEIRLADERVFAGRRLHEELAPSEDDPSEQRRSFSLSSSSLGVTGKVDAVRRREGPWVPYEYKRGRANRVDKKAVAWEADRIQVCAYAMLLEQELGEPVPEARVRYMRDGVTVRVSVDEAARQDVRSAVGRARQLAAAGRRPPVTDHERRCLHCSLAPVCLPEEERLAQDRRWEPVRLFPPDIERQTVHVTRHGARIRRKGESLVIENAGEQVEEVPVQSVGAVVLHGYPQLTTQALILCAAHDVQVHWLSAGGKYVSGLVHGPPVVHRRLRQYEALSDVAVRLNLARRLVVARLAGQMRYILRATRNGERRTNEVLCALENLRSAIKQSARAEDADSLRGCEGAGARDYFSAVPFLLRAELPDEMRFTRRSRRPPKDRFNALLGFGYALLYQAVMRAVMSVGLDPALGFYHTPRSAAHPLVLDLVELFRVPVWDMPMMASLNRLQWNPDKDFDVAPGRVWLSSEGRRKAIQLFEERLQQQWKHQATAYSLSYARIMELEVRLLEKEWTGPGGLFAKMKLR